MMNGKAERLCACGCGQPNALKFNYIRGHKIRRVLYCQCGCGERLMPYRGKKYLNHHHAMLASWKNPEMRAKMIAAHREVHNRAAIKKSKSEKMKKYHSENPDTRIRARNGMLANFDWDAHSKRMKAHNPMHNPTVRINYLRAMGKRWFDKTPPEPTKIQRESKVLIDIALNVNSKLDVQSGIYFVDVVPFDKIGVEINGVGHYVFRHKFDKLTKEEVWGRDVKRMLDLTRRGWTIIPVEHDNYNQDMDMAISIIQDEMRTQS